MPPLITQKQRGSGLLIMAIVSAAIVGLTAVSLAKVNNLAFNGLDSSKTALQAQQYAASKAELIRSINYDDLTAQNKTTIQNSNFQDEVKISAESSYPSDSSIKQKICTINVYKTGESLPRSTLIVTRLSTKPDSGVPKGSIIPWYGLIKDIPSGFALCDGKNGTPDLRNRFLVGAGSSYNLGNSGGFDSIAIKKENLPSDGLNAFGYSCVGHYCTWGQGNFGERSGEYMANPSKDGSNGWQDYFYFTAFSSLLSNNWKGIPLDNRPPYYAVYYIMKL